MWDDAEEFLKKDKYLGRLVVKYGHCTIRPSKGKDYFRDLVYSIIEQQLSAKAATTIYERFKGILGNKITPEQILLKKDTTLRKSGTSFSKIKYIKDLASQVKDKELILTSLNKYNDDEIIKKLTQVKGIGPWTADMFLMFSLARPDVFPVGDLGIIKGVKYITKKEYKAQKLAKYGQRWKPFRTVASWYIWRSLENK